MTTEQILKLGGFPNTKAGRKAFYKKYPTKESFEMKFGGIANPQAPTADEFFSNTFAPNTPRGFYAQGGVTDNIAYPMQPPADYFFSAYPFTPEYQGGGTVSEMWQEVTGTPWSEAKKQGLTDGSFDANIALMKRIQAGEFNQKEFKDPGHKSKDKKKEKVVEPKYAPKFDMSRAAKPDNTKVIKNIQPFKGYTSEAEYQAHLLDPYSPEKVAAQNAWNLQKGKEKAAAKAKTTSRAVDKISKEAGINLESGMITDRNKNVMYVIKKGKVVKEFKVGTGANRDLDVSDIPNKSVDELDKMSPAQAKKYKITPRGAYLSVPEGADQMYGKPGFWMAPINYPGMPDKRTLPTDMAQHLIYGIGPKGSHGYDPMEGARRMKLMAGPGDKRNFSYGCTNMYGEDIDCLTGQLFPKGDTTFVVDTRLPKDVEALKKFGIKPKKYGGLPGGANDMPCFECGGYTEEGGSVSAFNYGQFPAIMGDGGEEYAKGGWIKKVSKGMEKRGTKGSFTKYCGGKVTDECIERGLNSPNPLTRKRAALAKSFRSIAKKQEGGDAGYGLDPNDVGKERSGYFIDILNRNRDNANMDAMIDEAMQYEDYMNAADMGMAQYGGQQTYMRMPGMSAPYSGNFNINMADDFNFKNAQNKASWDSYITNQEEKHNTGQHMKDFGMMAMLSPFYKQQYLKPKKAKSEILSGPLDLPSAPLPDERPTNTTMAQFGYEIPTAQYGGGSKASFYDPNYDPSYDPYTGYPVQNTGYSIPSTNVNPVSYGPGFEGYNADSDGNGVADYLQMNNPQMRTTTPEKKEQKKKWWETVYQNMVNPQKRQETTTTTTPGTTTTDGKKQEGQPSSGLTVTYGPQGWGKSRFSNYNEAYMAPQNVWASRMTKKRGIIPWNKTLTYEFWHSPTQQAQMQTNEKVNPNATNDQSQVVDDKSKTTTTTTTTNTNTNTNVTPGTNNNTQPDQGGKKAAKAQNGVNVNNPADNVYERMEPINPLGAMIEQQRKEEEEKIVNKMQLQEPDPFFKTTNEYKIKNYDPFAADKMLTAGRFLTSGIENRNLQDTKRIASEKQFAEANRRGLKAGEAYRGYWDPNLGNIQPNRMTPGMYGDYGTTQYGGSPEFVVPYVQYGGMPFGYMPYGGMPYGYYQEGGQFMDMNQEYMQEGGEGDDVRYMSDEEIQQLRAQGIQVDYLD